MMKRRCFPASAIIFFLTSVPVFSVPVAFPGAEGAGRFATGGRGGTVYEVTNLNNSGPGSIVDAVSVGNRTIVFRVSGTIELGNVLLRPKSNTTIAGQTAPGDGICLKGRIYLSGANNVIIRYLRVRVDAGLANSSGDAIDIVSGSNIIIDHVSASYARDETISCQDGSNNVTVQWCILSEALTFENHSYGSLIRGQYGEKKSYHHNLYAHNRGRNPRPGNYLNMSVDPEGLYFDFRNNVIYNWSGTHPGNNFDTSAISRYNFINNVYIHGPGSSGTKIFGESSTVSHGYFSGNAHGTSYWTVNVPSDPWSLVTFSGFTTAQINAYKARAGGVPIPMEPVTTTSAAQALGAVLAYAGASFPSRDTVDLRMVSDVMNKTGTFVVNTPLASATQQELDRFWPPLQSRPAPADSDRDGMTDAWEIANGLNPYNAIDRNYYTLHPDYTNLEVYLNWILENDLNAPAAPAGLWATIRDGAVHLDWLDNTEGDFAAYNVYRSTTPGGGYVLLTGPGIAVSAFTDSTVLLGSTYFYAVTAKDMYANESAASAEISATLSDTAMGAILREYWTGIAGSAVSDLTSHADYPNNPAGRGYLANLEGPINWANSYGTRIRGYLHPPISGNYIFYIAGDNDSQLWLSSDGTPENASLIASVQGSTNPRQWNKYPSQQSSAIPLAGGRKYYIEVLHKEDSAGDHIAVAWSGPGMAQQVIAGQFLSSWFVGLYGDVTGDVWVGPEDLPDFIAVWLESDCAAGSAWDLNGDCFVDLYEFSVLAGNWMNDIQ